MVADDVGDEAVQARRDLPAWLPASVGSARRGASIDAGSLHSGAPWGSLLESLGRAGEFVRAGPILEDGAGDVSGYRHLLVLLALGIDEALREGNPYEPVIAPGNVDNVLKWGMDCPDALYVGSAVRSDATYRVTGRRGSVRYLGFQIMGGIESDANLVADDLEIAPDGSFELLLSADERPGNWMPLTDHASSLVVRQFFYDWDSEQRAELKIECLTRPDGRGSTPARGTDPDQAAGLGRQLVALGSFIEESLRFWWDIEEMGRREGLNAFREPAARTDIGGAAENVTVWGSWELAEDEALLIEVTPPESLYWSVSLGNQWWESIDYAAHQSSLNGHQAVLDADGVFRAVVAHGDPGVANWLDPAGSRRGPMIFRWVRATGAAPVPTTKVIRTSKLAGTLPPATRLCPPDERAAVLARRRAAVQRRFGR